MLKIFILIIFGSIFFVFGLLMHMSYCWKTSCGVLLEAAPVLMPLVSLGVSAPFIIKIDKMKLESPRKTLYSTVFSFAFLFLIVYLLLTYIVRVNT